MAELNKNAAEVMQKVGVNACTDITGFGLHGHLLEMMNASNSCAKIEFDQIRFLPKVLKLAVAGNIPGGTRDNLAYTNSFVTYGKNISDIKKLIINDAQTSGGLLISVSKIKARQLLDLLKKRGIKSATKIGEVSTSKKSKIEIR
jgi:selenide,water dikinase